ncbi:MAG: hypothetical protein JSS74_06360 [Actinobacteria bacterium]|nr:hypothetical protein [Actinomycetota bacterium]
MYSIAPQSSPGSWQVADALSRCDSARERVEIAVAGLRALEDGMHWQARAIAPLRAQLAEHARELNLVHNQLGAVASALAG